MEVFVVKERFDPEVKLAAFREVAEGAGAVVSFTGIVRADVRTRKLRLTHYPDFTEAAIAEMIVTARARWDLTGVQVLHRVGTMDIGDPIVFVATASAHRRDAFEAADFLMDYLKSEAPFWKQEIRADSTVWIEPRVQDLTDKARWDKSCMG